VEGGAGRKVAALIGLLVALGAIAYQRNPDALGERLYAMSASTEFERWYPDDITPPEGTEYPCALTALPRDLQGIPPTERGYVDHICAKLLEAIHLRLELTAALSAGGDASEELAAYEEGIAPVLAALAAEEGPPGLASFQEDVVRAIELQREAFRKAVPLRADGATMEQVWQLGEVHESSKRLLTAWGTISARYQGGWSPAVMDSVYHHLCALDFV